MGDAEDMEDDWEGLGLLFTDLRVGLLLLSEGRYQLLNRAFGISRDQANVVTLVLLGTMVAAAHQKLAGMAQPLTREQRADLWLGGAAARELISELAGAPARQTPHSGDLLMLVAAAVAAKPVIRAAGELHPGRRLAGGFRAFRHRYGHHLQAGRARLSSRAAQPAT